MSDNMSDKKKSAEEGGYFQGEGHEPFDGEVRDAESREGEAVADDLLNIIGGGGKNASVPTADSGPKAGSGGSARAGAPGAALGAPHRESPDGTAGASDTSRGSASASPGAGRIG